ncbi:MAG: YfbR-like 5'-deoxynucleotidase [Candidatus Paceibacterota bacterium]|jgi:5'-deoxynucleotidase
MSISGSFLLKLRGLNHVHRWNFHPTLRRENVAEHSFWVAIIAYVISSRTGCICPGDVILSAILHDAEEAVTGDMPSLVKRFVNWEPVEQEARDTLTNDVALSTAIEFSKKAGFIKIADMVSALMYATEQVQCGNTHFKDIEAECLGDVRKLADSMDKRQSRAVYAVLDELGYKGMKGKDRPKQMTHL